MTDRTGPAASTTAPGDHSQPTRPKRVRVHHLREAKQRAERITMLTAYDAPTARIWDEAGTDLLLVGDSVGDNMLGMSTTIPVTVDQMVHHTRAVTSAVHRALVIADLPFGSYEASPEQAHATSVRLMKEGGAAAVKLEGGRRVRDHVRLLVDSGIPVMGHLGFTPQSEMVLGGKRVQGRGAEAAELLSEDALALQEAGAFAVVLEMVPAPLAARVTEVLDVPTIGIGAGPECDGQVLVWTDVMGLGDWSPRFAQRYAEVGSIMASAARAFNDDVRGGLFPRPEHSFDD